jgi:hypothetical protein
VQPTIRCRVVPDRVAEEKKKTRAVADAGLLVLRCENEGYLTVTFAPASWSFLAIASASSLAMPSLTGLGALSTNAFASVRPSEVTSRTALMTLIFSGPASSRMTSNSV